MAGMLSQADIRLLFPYAGTVGMNTDQPVASASRSSARVPSLELPRVLRPGDQTAMLALPGTMARMPPPTPDLQGPR